MIDVMTAVLDVAASVSQLVPAENGGSDSEGGAGWLLILGPVGAGAVYAVLYRYYRNTDKSHKFEQETLITAQPVTGSDSKFDEVHGTQRSSINGDNVRRHRKRVQRVNLARD